MATAKKTTPATPARAKTAAAAAPAKNAAAPAKKAAAAPAAAKKVAAKAPVARKAAAPAAAKAAVAIKPVKETFTKSALALHLAEQSGVEPKAVKAVLVALESAILGSVHKRGQGEFTLPGLLKIGVQKVDAKKKRFGKDPFSGEERWFPAKPASVRIKARALKKLKDAAL